MWCKATPKNGPSLKLRIYYFTLSAKECCTLFILPDSYILNAKKQEH